MTGITVLDIVIGLVFVYLLYSLFATIIQEFIASNFGFRAKILEKAIVRMLEDKNQFSLRIESVISLFRKNCNSFSSGLSNQFYEHPLIKFLGEDKFHSKPSYLKKESFSKVMIDLLRGDEAKPGSDIRTLIQDSLDNKIANWGKVPIGKQTLSYLKSIWTDAQGDVDKFREYLENWFDETMERASGWYKKYTQVVLFCVGLIIAILFNVDTIKIVDKLNKDPKLREQLVQQADVFMKAHPDLDLELQKEKIENENKIFGEVHSPLVPRDSLLKKTQNIKLDSLSTVKYEELKKTRDTLITRSNNLMKGDIRKANGLLGIGRNSKECKCHKVKCFFISLPGWIITALAISLGASFWFDLLNKLMKLRSSVSIPTESDDSSDKKSTKDTNKQAIG
jgi:hypothetical protein